MHVRLHLIVGKTGVGKTARSIEWAESTGAPVVVLDRIQCYPELAVGSGRPLDDKLRGTRRIYLASRRVTDGDLDATAAHLLLMEQVEQLASENDTIILEGGSTSLLKEMMKSPFWKGYQRSYEHLRGTYAASYQARVLQRVRGMLHAPAGEKSILAELAGSWALPEARAFVETVVGYDAITAWCRETGVHPDELRLPLSPEQIEVLAQRITAAHLAYARMQEGVFEQMDAYWPASRYSAPPSPGRPALTSTASTSPRILTHQ